MAQEGKVQQGKQLTVQGLKHCSDSLISPQAISHPGFLGFCWVGLQDTAQGGRVRVILVGTAGTRESLQEEGALPHKTSVL